MSTLMDQVQLKRVVRFHYGSALKASERETSGPYTVFGSNGPVGRHTESVVDFPTIIVGRKGSVGSVHYAPKGGWPIDTTYYAEIIDKSEVHLRYLFYALKQARLDRHTIVTSIPGLNRDDLYSTTIPLPPLSEQKRIADILDKADAIRRKRRQAAGAISFLRRSLFLDRFGEATEDSRTWPLVPLEDVVSRPITYGILKPGDNTLGGVPMLRIQDIRDGQVCTDNLHCVSRELSQQYKRTILNGGEIVLSLVGTIGLVAVVPSVLRGANVHRNLGVIVPGDRVRTSYLYHLMLSPVFEQLLSRTVKGGIQRLLNLGDLGRVEIRIPPLNLQEQFEARIERHSAVAYKARSLTEASNDLFKSLVQRAFRGEL